MPSLREVMAKDPIGVGPDATVAEAAAAMVRHRVGSLLVEQDDEVVGIVTERDVLRAAGTEGDLLSTRVRDWMTREPTTASADDSVEDAAVVMLDGGFRHLPVTDGDDVVGIVSLRGLFSAHVGVQAQQPADAAEDATDSAPDSSPDAVQERRERMFEVTRALQTASRATVADSDAWRSDLGTAVDDLAAVVRAHIAATEGPGGLFEELQRESGGRLGAAVRRLRREHERSTVLLDDLRDAVAAHAEPSSLRQAADELFAQLEAHRHRGSDLLWQAYGVELGGDG